LDAARYNPAVLHQSVVRALLLGMTVLTIPTVGFEAFLGLLGRRSYLLWSVNFVVLVVAVLAATLFAALALYRSWQTTRSYLV
jgi:hypothetical protein